MRDEGRRNKRKSGNVEKWKSGKVGKWKSVRGDYGCRVETIPNSRLPFPAPTSRAQRGERHGVEALAEA